MCSQLIFGSWGLGGASFHNPSYGEFSADSAKKLLDAVLMAGVLSFDTAPPYGSGQSEARLGDMLYMRQNDRKKITISTKFGFNETFKKIEISKANVENSLTNSLKRLKTDYIDIYLWHSPTIDEIKLYAKKFNEICEKNKVNGKIKKWGISLKSPSDIKHIPEGLYPDILQLNFNAMDQRALHLKRLKEMKNKSTILIARTPFFFGFLANRNLYKQHFDNYDHRSKMNKASVRKLSLYSRFLTNGVYENGKLIPMTELSLRYIYSLNLFSSIILGSLNIDEWTENIGILKKGRLTEESSKLIELRYKNIEKYVKLAIKN